MFTALTTFRISGCAKVFACQKELDIFCTYLRIWGRVTIWPLWTCANVFCLSKRSWYFHMSCANLRYHYNMNLMESTNINVLHNVQCTYPRDPDEDDPGWNGQKFSLAKSTWDVSPRWAMSQPGTCNFCQLLLFKVFSTQRSRSLTVFAWWTQLIQFLTSNCVSFTLFNTYKGSKWLHLRSTTL